MGRTDALLNTVSVYAKQEDDQKNKYQKGVIFYAEGDKVRGIGLLYYLLFVDVFLDYGISVGGLLYLRSFADM